MLSLKEITSSFIDSSKAKMQTPILHTLLLAIMAGVFIAFAGIGYTLTLGISSKFIAACVFPAGIIMVVVGGARLFTGECLLVMPLIRRDIKALDTLKTLVIVYVGNFIGSLLIAVFVVYSGVLDSVKLDVISTAVSKSSLPFGDALLRGILCNILVCVAVWLSFATHSVTGKIVAMFLPILVFVVAGFEHSVANMYFIPSGIFTALKYGMTDSMDIMLKGLYANLLPVTLGNIIGGAMVAIVYSFSVKVDSSDDSTIE